MIVVFVLISFVGIYFYGLYRHGPPRGPSRDFVKSHSASKGHFARSLFSYGYFKASLRQLRLDLERVLYVHPLASQGKPAPDGQLFTLSGTPKQLYQHFILPAQQKKIPLILNFGSCS
jgi:hypothetical protein